MGRHSKFSECILRPVLTVVVYLVIVSLVLYLDCAERVCSAVLLVKLCVFCVSFRTGASWYRVLRCGPTLMQATFGRLASMER